MENTSIGARIKQRRKEIGLTQTKIHQETGISSGNLSDIENGNKLPSTPALISLSTILSCSIDWILKGEIPINESKFLSDEREALLVDGFRELPEAEKEELMGILEMKLHKVKRAAEKLEKSLASTNADDDSMVG